MKTSAEILNTKSAMQIRCNNYNYISQYNLNLDILILSINYQGVVFRN